MNIFEATMADAGYQTKTTFWDDFTIADQFGVKAVEDTYRKVFNEWKDNVEYITELVLVLNHKIWQHYTENNVMAATYNELWDRASDWALDNFEGEDLDYFFRTVD